MQVCVDHEPGVFFHLLLPLYRSFSKHLFGSQDILYLIVSNIDPTQVCVNKHRYAHLHLINTLGTCIVRVLVLSSCVLVLPSLYTPLSINGHTDWLYAQFD